MASPFSIFRRNQKAAMAVLTIMLMVSFTIGISLTDMFGPGDSQNPVVARTRHKTYHSSDENRMFMSRRLATQFIEMARHRATDSPQPFIASVQSMLDQQFGPPFGSLSPSQLMRDRVLADYAKRIGLVISDTAIVDYINLAVEQYVNQIKQFVPSLTGKLSKADYGAILDTLHNQGRTGFARSQLETQLVESIRTELMIRKLAEMFTQNVMLTPAQRWEYFLRLNRKVKAEVLPVKAEDMLGQVVEDPSESTLKEFFNKFKEREALPGSPEPGFKIPHRADFQYFQSDYEKLYELAAASITPDEIEKEYEKNKETEYRWQSFGNQNELDEMPAEKPAAGTPKTDAPKTETPKNEPPKSDGSSKNPPAKTEEPAKSPATTVKPESKKPDEKEKSEEQKSDDKPSAPSESKKSAENPDEKKSSSLRGALPALALAGSDLLTAGMPGASLLALVAADDAKDGDKPAEPAKPSEEKSAGKKSDETEKKPEPKEDAKSPAATETTDTQPAVKAPASPPALISEEELLPMSIKEGPEPKYSPLWKVEKDIRKKLAEQRVAERVKNALDDIRDKQATYLTDQTIWENGSKKSPEPKPLDYQSLAKKHELSLHTTGLIDALQFSKMPDIGSAMMGRELLVAALFGSKLPLNQSRHAQDTKGNQYLIWKTEDRETRVPSLDEKEIRDGVVHTWKMMKVRDLAVKKAEGLAQQAIVAKQSLTELFGSKPDLKVTETNEFTWMTMGTAGGADFNRNVQASLSEVQGVDEPGEAFMQKVSELGVGDVSVALNQPETIAYVVRLTIIEPSDSVLQTTFLSQNLSMYQSVAMPEYRRQQEAWMEYILREEDYQPEGTLAPNPDET